MSTQPPAFKPADIPADARIAIAIDGRVRSATIAKSAIDGARMWIALGEGEAARIEGQGVLDRFASGARSTDLALAKEE